MITRISRPGGNPRRLVGYLTRKSGEEQRLLFSNVPGGANPQIGQVIEDVTRAHRARKGRFVKHMILSFPPCERLPDEELKALARFYLDRMGYADAPYAVYLHTDTDHPHLHIVTTPTTFFGEIISEDFDARRSQSIAREIEKRWDLRRVASPETASFQAPKRGELERAERTGGVPARTRFQLDIAEAGYEAHGLHDFVYGLRARGYQVKLSIDREGQLHGASYEKDGVRFKGSQLGKAYQGNRLVEAFQLDYSPKHDREAVLQALAAQNPSTRRSESVPRPSPEQSTETVSPSGPEEPTSLLSRLAERLRSRRVAAVIEVPPTPPPLPRPEPPPALWQDKGEAARAIAQDRFALRSEPGRPARDLPALHPLRHSLPLPAGLYQLAGIEAAAPGSESRVITGKQVHWKAAGWSPERIDQARMELIQQQNRFVLLRPEPDRHEPPMVAFRNLTDAQLQALRGAGIQPALLVRHGERFDVLLRLHEGLDESRLHRLREQLAQAFELPQARGAWHAAIHLPGSLSDPVDPRSRVQLIEIRQESFAASPRWVERASQDLQAEALLRSSRWSRLDLSRPLEGLPEDLPAAALAQALEPRPELPAEAPEPLRRLQAEVEAVRHRPPESPPHLARLADEYLYREARGHSPEVLRALGSGSGAISSAEARGYLLALEAEIAHRNARHLVELDRHEQRLTAAADTLDHRTAEALASATLPALQRYDQATRAYASLAEAHQGAELRYLRSVHAQLQLDRERFEVALLSLHSEKDRQAYDRLVAREVQLARRVEDAIALTTGAEASPEALRHHLEDATRRAAALREELAPGGLEALGHFREAVREQAITALYLERAEARQAALAAFPPPSQPERVAPGQRVLRGLVDYQQHLARLGDLDTALESLTAHAPARLRAALRRVVAGDVSPEALRRLNGAVIASDQLAVLPVPRRSNLPEDPAAFRDRLQVVTARLSKHVARITAEPTAGDLGKIWKLSTEAVHLHQRVEALYRRQQRLRLPPPAPKGLNPSAWEAAWLRHVTAGGMRRVPPQVALAHVRNARLSPMVALQVGGRLARVGFRLLEKTLRAAMHHQSRALRL